LRRVWAIISREFLERVRSGWFVAGTILGPVLMVALISLPLVLAGRGTAGHGAIVVLDAARGEAGTRLLASLAEAGVSAARLAVAPAEVPRANDSLAGRVGLGLLDGFLVLTDATVTAGRVEYHGGATSPAELRLLAALAREAVAEERLRRRGVDWDLAAPPVVLATTVLDQPGRDDATATLFLAFGTWFLLYATITLYGVQVMTSVVEEKTTRLAEVIFTSVKPWQALTGKIVGIGAVGVLQLAIWGVAARILVAVAELRVPALSVSLLAVALAFFAGGYLLYAALFGAAGALVSSDAEARQVQIPIIVLLMVPSVLMVGILADPGGTLARVLSQVPFTSPIAMPVRVAVAGARGGEVATSLIVLAVTIVGVMWLADRIYRTGVVTHIAGLRLKDVVKWVKG
jgi:ABC-2 type transport system permease protein